MGSGWMIVPLALAAVGVFLALMLIVVWVVVLVEDRRRRGRHAGKH